MALRVRGFVGRADRGAEATRINSATERRVADAEHEVAVLARRRDEIAAELAALSGVIEALAVPGAIPDGPGAGPRRVGG